MQDKVANEQDYVDLGWCCADVCEGLVQGLEGRELHELGPLVLETIEHFTA